MLEIQRTRTNKNPYCHGAFALIREDAQQMQCISQSSQRNRTKRIYIYIYIVLAFMETEESHSFQSANGTPRKAGGVEGNLGLKS